MWLIAEFVLSAVPVRFLLFDPISLVFLLLL
jgi:hypothetical protein